MNTSSGLYGTVRPALVKPNDVDIYYYYRPTRGTTSQEYSGFVKADSNAWFEPAVDSDGKQVVGLYNLKLPLNVFNSKGIYTVYLKPKEVEATIKDVSVLQAYSDVKGLVFSVDVMTNNSITDLTGYRVEYLDDNKDPLDISRLITSCNYCAPVRVAISDAYPNTIRYRLINESSNGLVFCTVTPSLANASKTNSLPFIGVAGEMVKLVNTKFDPQLFEIEMVEHDADTISTMLEGDQIRDLDHGIITTYNENKEIYKQQEFYTLKSSNGVPLYDVKIKRTNIDRTQSYDNIIE